MSAFGQSPVKNYDSEWKKVEDFSKKGLPKSALEEVDRIYEQAKRERQDAQIVKSLVYRLNLQAELREDYHAFATTALKEEIKTAKEPARSILYALLAEAYRNRYEALRWQIMGRTTVLGARGDDPDSWSAEDFMKEIGDSYLKSIEQEALLKATGLAPFDAIITKGNARKLRPTLYDLLVHKALRFFESDERMISKPAYAFEINQQEAFAEAADFARFSFESRDPGSLDYKALRLYQDLLLFHGNDSDPDALIDADIQRIAFVYRKSVHPGKEALYRESLERIIRRYGNHPGSAQAGFLLAQWYVQKAGTYRPYEDTTHRYAAVTAFTIADSIIKKFPESEGGINLFNLKNRIEAKQLLLNTDKVSIPGKPFLISLQYKNTAKVFFKIIKVTEELRSTGLREGQNKLMAALAKAPVVKAWDQPLPDTKDFQAHRTEVKADPLPVGEYYLVASTEAPGQASSLVVFYVSDISFVNQGPDYFVLHRDTGRPLKGIKVQTWRQRYSNRPAGYVREKGGTYETDENGYFRLERDSLNIRSNFFLEFIGKEDRLMIDELQYASAGGTRGEKKDTQTMFFFTDRSIYRPGQTVYFKGILLNRKPDEKRTEIIAGRETVIQLLDANGQKADSVVLSTNEFGTVSGTFVLPQGGLNGLFRIAASGVDGASHFRVEEYKRPKYKVEIEKPGQAVRLNDTVTVTGLAKAFAGNSIDGAAVRYRVERVVRFPYPWRFSRGWWPVSAPMQLVHGETVTDAGGKFIIRFTAIPDRSLAIENDPVFDYLVYADVTDGSGETRSARQTVSVGYKPVILKTEVPGKLEKDSIATLRVYTENMNGTFVPTEVVLTARKLMPEPRLIRARQWERPDQFVLSRATFLSLFPNDEYDNELDPESWAKGAPVLTAKKTTEEEGKWDMSAMKELSPGFYELEFVAATGNGETVKDIRRVEITDSSKDIVSRPEYLWTKASDPVEPGETAEIRLGTFSGEIFLIRTTDRPEKADDEKSYRFLSKKDGIERYVFSTTEADRGGFGVSFLFVKHNRVYQFQDAIKVPWSNKELDITYGTFRDKTLPGSEETWTLTVAGPGSGKVAAELLAGMYDASLDEFSPHVWQRPAIWPVYSSRVFWNGNAAFGGKFGHQVPVGPGTGYKSVAKTYDRLISLAGYFGEEVVVTGYGGGRARRESVSMMAAPAVAEAAMDRMVSKQAVANDYVEAGESESADTVSPDQPARRDFRETAFFLPQLRTDPDGRITFTFTLPEALTKWKFQALAHSGELAFGYSTQEIITRKELMVQPNIPRFVRAGDNISISTRVVNLSDKALEGGARLSVADAVTGASLDDKFGVRPGEISFNVEAGRSTAILFPLSVPEGYTDPVTIRIVAAAGQYSDGEDNMVPVLTNRMLVTETLPLSMRGTGNKSFTFEKLLKSRPGGTLTNHALTVEYTGNPAWYAIQALPYLMEYPYDCAEQVWNRYYANALASHIAGSSPRIEQVFKTWRDLDTSALLSDLHKNQELKSVLLEETPWVLEARSEAEQKRNIALLFDMVRMKGEAAGALSKLQQMQRPEGSFPWFAGGPDDRFVTQYILSGIGHLYRLTSPDDGQREVLNSILFRGLAYLDSRLRRDYDELVRSKSDLKKYTPSAYIVQYLYMRSFFPEYGVPSEAKAAYNYYRGRVAATWMEQSRYLQAMTSLAMSRTGNKAVAQAIIRSLGETAIQSNELGTYWKSVRRSWWWYEAPVEQHALLAEAFEEVAGDREMADGIRTWLLINKQTNRWESTKATAEACYALLLRGSEWLNDNPDVKIVLGGKTVSSADGKEAGTGYFKTSFPANEVNPDQGKIELSVSGSEEAKSRPSWGGVYWQYFEDLDNITFSETPLKLKKQLFIETNTDRGPVLKALTNGNEVSVGDRIKVRIELSVDRDMEYVHMKDMRASGFEPVNVLSTYKWQGGLAYYESTKDAATHFFFNLLPKGKYVFEYPLNVSHEGDFSNGVTTIQCMYAPEFTAHSEGIRVMAGR